MAPNFLLRLNGAKNYKSGMILFDERLLIVEKLKEIMVLVFRLY